MSPVVLAPLVADHLPLLRSMMRDPEVLRFTRTPDPMPEGWLEQWHARFDGHDRHAWAVLDDTGRLVGYAVTGPVDHEGRTVEVGYAVAPAARGQGVATQVLRLLSRWALERGMERVTALISVENPASSRVAEKVGYTYEGVLRSMHHQGGRRVDLQSWSLLPGELSPEADAPTS